MQKKILFIFFILFFIFGIFFLLSSTQKPYFRDILAGTDEMIFICQNKKNLTDTIKLKNKRLINDFLREISENFLTKNLDEKIKTPEFTKNPFKYSELLFAKIIFSRKKFKLVLCEGFIFSEKNDFYIVFLYKNKFYTQILTKTQQDILHTAVVFPDFIEDLP